MSREYPDVEERWRWMKSRSDTEKFPEKGNPQRRALKFYRIARKYPWNVYAYIKKLPENVQESVQPKAKSLCLKKNIRKNFHRISRMWRIPSTKCLRLDQLQQNGQIEPRQNHPTIFFYWLRGLFCWSVPYNFETHLNFSAQKRDLRIKVERTSHNTSSK